jgi:hypothetical protein
MSHLYVLASSSSFFAELGEHLFFFSRPERVAVFYVLLHLQQQPQKAGGFVNRDSQDNAPKSTHYRKAPNRCILYAIQ